MRHFFAELNVGEAGSDHHLLYLFARETMLQAGPKPVKSIRPHGVKAGVPIVAQREVADVTAQPLCQFRYPRKRPVNA
jgi:hypothetical protein